MLALAGNNGEQESATFGLQPRRTKEAAPSLRADGADGNWLRGLGLNQRPSGYEAGVAHRADGRHCWILLRDPGVVGGTQSTGVHWTRPDSPLFWTRFGHSSSGWVVHELSPPLSITHRFHYLRVCLR